MVDLRITDLRITIDNVEYEVREDFCDDDFFGLADIFTEDETGFYVGPRALAERATRDYWEDMAKNDVEEFAHLVGTDVLVSWALGRPAGPGAVKVHSLEEWLDLVAECCDEDLAREDGVERYVQSITPDLAKRLCNGAYTWIYGVDLDEVELDDKGMFAPQGNWVAYAY